SREGGAHVLLRDVLPRLAVLDELMPAPRRPARPPCALVFQDDLGQRDGGQILARSGVDDRDLPAAANHLLDLLEGDVPALLRVVELPVRVAFDDVRHRVTASLTPCVT